MKKWSPIIVQVMMILVMCAAFIYNYSLQDQPIPVDCSRVEATSLEDRDAIVFIQRADGRYDKIIMDYSPIFAYARKSHYSMMVVAIAAGVNAAIGAYTVGHMKGQRAAYSSFTSD